jgi:hypothetical protein
MSVSRGSVRCPRLALMVKDCSGCINPAARAFGVSGLTHPLQSLRRPGRRGRGQTDPELGRARCGGSGRRGAAGSARRRNGRCSRCDPRLSRWRRVLPLLAGIGATPHRWANAGDQETRSGRVQAVGRQVALGHNTNHRLYLVARLRLLARHPRRTIDAACRDGSGSAGSRHAAQMRHRPSGARQPARARRTKTRPPCWADVQRRPS